MRFATAYLGEAMIRQGLGYISKSPEKNLNKILDWSQRIARDPYHKQLIESVRNVLQDPNSPWPDFMVKAFEEIHPNIRDTIAINYFVNGTFLGVPKQQEVAKRLGASVPFAVLMDPTARCNLKCTGCWAGEYKGEDLSLEVMDRVLTEAEELGIYFIVLSGGEPTLRRKDIFELARRHPEQVFHLFTNGTMINEQFVEAMVDVGNVTLAISLEGMKEHTDERRGEGVFESVMHSMDLLKQGGCLYGASVTYTRKNVEHVASEEFIDLLIDKGARFVWYFTYIPVGASADLDLMATPEQRAYMHKRTSELRMRKPIFLMDFWNDGAVSGGCIAGGRRYMHINAAGEVEPCAFVHYATHNINEVSLEEALKSPLFLAYQKRQPFNQNHLRPCPLIDNPDAMRDMVHESNAHSTEAHVGETADEFAAKLQDYAGAWGDVADGIEREERAAREGKVG
ncbi:MAG: radical SAM protein [Firmicutes bacterium]|nr:radical SAM protein [Bacillota bacterium]